jgi:hypothetical protein
MLNAIAPVGTQGVNDASPNGYYDAAFNYVYNRVLTANQAVTGDTVSIFSEADFCFRALVFQSTGLFGVRFQDGQGLYLDSGFVYSTNYPNNPGDPFPWLPQVVYPASGRIWIDIEDLSGNGNTVQILFVGANRWPL